MNVGLSRKTTTESRFIKAIHKVSSLLAELENKQLNKD
jgi:hypothetical protein